MQGRDDTAQRRRNMATGVVLAFLALAVYGVVFLKLFVAQ